MSTSSTTLPLRPSARILAVAAGLQALLPLSTDIYLAGMTALGRDFGVGVAGVQRTMVAFAIGLGLAHLVIGGLADHFGRKPVAIGGLVLYLAATVAGVMAPTLETLVAARFVQGASAAAGPILMRAVLRDTVPPAEAPRYFSLVGTVAGLAPVTAPLLGAAAASFGGWRASLAVLFAYATALVIAIALLLPETLRAENKADSRFGSPFRVLGELLASREFRVGAVTIIFGYGGLFTWLSTGAFLLGSFGYGPLETALVYGLGSAGFLAGNSFSLGLVRRFPPARILMGAGCFGMIGTLVLLATVVSGAQPPVIAMVLLVQPFYMSFGMAQPIANAVAMRPFGRVAGQASSWFGICQQLGAACLSSLAVAGGAGPATLAVMILGMAGVALSGLMLQRQATPPRV